MTDEKRKAVAALVCGFTVDELLVCIQGLFTIAMAKNGVNPEEFNMLIDEVAPALAMMGSKIADLPQPVLGHLMAGYLVAGILRRALETVDRLTAAMEQLSGPVQ